MTDEEFQTAIEALAKGEKDSLKRIYESYVRLIYAVVYDVVKSREEAEDITSEFFIKLVRVAGGFRKGSPHKAWLVQIARNMAIDVLRKRQREVLEFEQDEDDNRDGVIERSQADSGKSSVEERAVLTEDMRQAMRSLSPKEKEIIDMKLMGQFTFKEIAALTGQPMGTVTWLYNQGIKKLRRCLADYEKG